MREFFTPYSYCGSDPVNYVDWMGLWTGYIYIDSDGDGVYEWYFYDSSACIMTRVGSIPLEGVVVHAQAPLEPYFDVDCSQSLEFGDPVNPENGTGGEKAYGGGGSYSGYWSSSTGNTNKQKVEERGAKGKSFYGKSDVAVDIGENTVKILEYADDVAPKVLELPGWMAVFSPIYQFFGLTVGFNSIVKEATDPGAQSFYGGLNHTASQRLMSGPPDSIRTNPQQLLKWYGGN
ncbi:MAG: hypothetical protein PHR06_13645 [Candidatus Cloacimonetes bacterium]|nr:hypothetical protein [Candidatus Cloacimonadota bacterium]